MKAYRNQNKTLEGNVVLVCKATRFLQTCRLYLVLQKPYLGILLSWKGHAGFTFAVDESHLLSLLMSADWFARWCCASQTETLCNLFHLWYEVDFFSSAHVLSWCYCIHLLFHLAQHSLPISYSNGCPYAYLETAPAFPRVTVLPRDIPDF